MTSLATGHTNNDPLQEENDVIIKNDTNEQDKVRRQKLCLVT